MELFSDIKTSVPQSIPTTYNDPFFDLDPNVPKIRVQDTPTTKMWAFVPLYKIDNTGAMRMWQIGFDGTNIRRRTGHLGTGNLLSKKPKPIVLNKSGRNLEQQALLNIRQYYNKKFTNGAFRPADYIHDIDIQPETAQIYPTHPIRFWPVAAMAKLDGERMRVLPRDNGYIKVTRSNHSMAHVTHIDPQLKILMSFLPPNTIIDGEMWKPGMKLQEIHSILSKVGHPDIVTLNYYIFDIYLPDTPYQVRYNNLVEAFKNYYESTVNSGLSDQVLLIVSQLVNNKEELDRLHKKFVDADYEGTIIHKVGTGSDTYYKPGKSTNMLKYKDYATEEGTIIGVLPCEGEEADLAKFIMKTDDGNTFKVRPAGEFGNRRRWLLNPNEVIGRRYTYSYRKKPYGIPTEVTGVGFREGQFGV